MNKRTTITDFYSCLLRKPCVSYYALGWENTEAHLKRMQLLVENFELENKKILDVGCGLGDLWAILQERNIKNIEYTGVDILKQMITIAKDRYPGVNFIELDIFSNNIFKKNEFDIVYSSGIFNLNLGNNYEFLKNALTLFFDITKDAAVVTMLNTRSEDKEDPFFYYEPIRVKKIASKIGFSAEIRDDYLQNDFCLIGKK